MDGHQQASTSVHVTLRIKEFEIPPVQDGLVLGKKSPVGAVAMRKALPLLHPAAFEHFKVKDEVIGDIFVRSNILLETESKDVDFPENQWIGSTLRIGPAVELQVTQSCPRCVMTTLAQPDLPRDTDILRTVVRHNAGTAGVYASGRQIGAISEGDPVILSRRE